jgi:hypothetical protein
MRLVFSDVSHLQVNSSIRVPADPSGRAVSGVEMRPFAYWDCGFESRQGVYICFLWVLCVVRSLRRADRLFRGILSSVVCLSVIMKPR